MGRQYGASVTKICVDDAPLVETSPSLSPALKEWTLRSSMMDTTVWVSSWENTSSQFRFLRSNPLASA